MSWQRGRQVSRRRALVSTIAFGVCFFLVLNFLLHRGHVAADAIEALIVAAFWGGAMWVSVWRPNAPLRKRPPGAARSKQ